MATFGGGLNLAVPENNSYVFKSFLADDDEAQFIRFVASDRNDWMWVGTSDGICVFHPDSLIESPDNYYRYNYGNGKLQGNFVKYILCDRKGRMWIATSGGGLSLCIPDGDYGDLSFKHFTTGNGLVGDDVQSIAEDNGGTLWIATEYGISHFSPETESFENFFFSTIAQGNVYSESTTCNLPDGRLLFGSSHGLVVIDPEKVKSVHTVSDVALTGLKINGINMFPNSEDSPLKHAFSYTDNIELKHHQNSFVIEFSAFDYSLAKGAKYMYRLEPYDADWNTPSSLNFAAYKKLTSGTYRLHVRACNSTGIWSDVATLGIVITPPWWKSPIAYLIYFILFCAVLYVTYRLMSKFSTLRTRVEVEKQLTDYKLMFFTNISHEFRTPLTLIQGALEKIENMSHISEEMAYPIRLMNKSADRMLRLINQLLEFRKMQNNKLTLMLEKTDVISFLKEIFLNFEEMADDKSMDFRFECPLESYSLFVDRGKLDKIVYNLLSNAFKYTPNGGKIRVSVSIDEKNEKFVFLVSDTGIGISKEKRQELFSRFMQSTFSQDSVGIGLHLTHELVNVHKGSITYRENEGGGSVFTISLPADISSYETKDFIVSDRVHDDAFAHEKPEHSRVMRSDVSVGISEKKKILLIEDDGDVSKFLETELSPHFDVTVAADGLSGLECARNLELDLIVCDVLMPGMNGFEVTRNLKTDFNTSHLPIILLTAMSTSENQLEGIESGADAYITKPFSPKLLLARVFQLIEQREKLRNKFSNDPTLMNPVLSTADLDLQFADRLSVIMEKQYANPDFTIDDFAAALKLGRTVFFRKVKGVTGYTPNEYIRIVRMKKAVQLLQDGRYNVSEVTYMVGMKDPHYFSRTFKEQFGVVPSAYLHGGKEE